jgi:undecaprenyl phosphate N,N'-diacetylbacillosamine 1-phosphate transferase
LESFPSSDPEAELIARFLASGHSPPRWNAMSRGLKRSIDIIAALAGLIVLLVPFLIVAVAIKIDSRGPVFFLRSRVGRGGELFNPWKFRTMVDEAFTIGSGFTVSRQDSRITRVGQLLRNWSVDELPQLLNVLAGTMSLVGPRPSWPHEVLQFDDAQLGRLRVRPGVTGLAAVSGRNTVPWDQRLVLDNRYIEEWSLCIDLKVIAVTPWKIAKKEGVYGQDGTNPPPSRRGRA